MSSMLKTKLYVPRPTPTLVARPRLIERLDEGLWWKGGFTRRLTLVSAPAGSGKTTLLAEWVRGCAHRVAWLSLDEGDNAATQFITYVIAAFQSVKPDVAVGLASALRSPQPPCTDSILSALINDLTTMDSGSSAEEPHGLVLVLDDYHVIDSLAVNDAVRFLIDNMPRQLHVILSTRTDPPLPLARLRARNELLEIRQGALRFTRREVEEFLGRAVGGSVSSKGLSALTSRTEGWIAGLQLAAICLRHAEDAEACIDAFSGSHRYVIDYLLEEVLSQQSEAVRTFLLRTAILDRMTPALCDAVTGAEDGRVMLRRLERDNVFVVPLGGERQWYRYHDLFRDVLRQRLLHSQAHDVPSLHRRASEWHEQNGLVIGAVDHALLGGDVGRALRLVDCHAPTLWVRGEHTVLLRWVDALPDERLRTRPQLCAVFALALFTAGRRDEADAYLAAARQALDTQASLEQPALCWMVDTVGAVIASSRGDLPQIISLSRRALDHLPDDDRTWRSIAAYTLGLAQRLRGDLTAAEGTLMEAVRLSTATGNSYVALIARHNLARLEAQRGHLRRAAEMLQRTERMAEETGLSHLPAAGLISAELGSILVEWNRLDEGLRLVERGIERLCRGRDFTSLAMSYAFKARALLAREDLDGAEDAIRTLDDLTEGVRVSPWIAYWITGLRLQALLERGDLASAARVVERVDVSLREEPVQHREIVYPPLIRLAIAQGRPTAGMNLLERLLHAAEDGERWGRVIATLALRAVARQTAGDVEGALADLSRALTLAEPDGYVRVFLDQGLVMGDLLRLAGTRGILPDYTRRLISELVGSAPGEPASEQPLIEPLTERELQVVRALASDLTMEEIGEELFVARSTIRSHAKSIYGKLNVHSRREAVRRARALGLFS